MLNTEDDDNTHTGIGGSCLAMLNGSQYFLGGYISSESKLRKLEGCTLRDLGRLKGIKTETYQQLIKFHFKIVLLISQLFDFKN